MKQSIKRIGAVLAMAMALSTFSAFGVFAEGEGVPAPASSATSAPTSDPAGQIQTTPTPVPTQEQVAASQAYIANYRVTGYEGDHYDKGERADIEVTIVDERAAAAGAKITARTNTPSFSANTNKDNGGNGNGTYTFIFRNVEYLGGGTTFSFEMSYSDAAPMQVLTQNLSMCVDTPDPTETPVPSPTQTPEYDYPKILVKDFSFGGNSVEAGKEFTLELTLFTTSGNANLQDVMVGLNFGELKGVSLASGSMNTYVGEMAPNTTKTISYKMITDATIEPGAISVNVNLSSKNGEPATSPISIPVTQPERFDITNMEAPETIMMGEEGYLSVTFVNNGKSSINNFSAEIQGDDLANPG